jgi:hypothetical protein
MTAPSTDQVSAMTRDLARYKAYLGRDAATSRPRKLGHAALLPVIVDLGGRRSSRMAGAACGTGSLAGKSLITRSDRLSSR